MENFTWLRTLPLVILTFSNCMNAKYSNSYYFTYSKEFHYLYIFYVKKKKPKYLYMNWTSVRFCLLKKVRACLWDTELTIIFNFFLNISFDSWLKSKEGRYDDPPPLDWLMEKRDKNDHLIFLVFFLLDDKFFIREFSSRE